jgi:hypothetical protein
MKTLDTAHDHVTDIREDLNELRAILSEHAKKYPGDKRRAVQMIADIETILSSGSWHRIEKNMIDLLHAR